MDKDIIPELQSAKNYGIIGIILEFVGSIADVATHGFGFIISIIGIIFILIAVKDISKYYGNQKPYRNMLYSVISSIILGVLSIIFVFLLLVPVITTNVSNSSGSTTNVSILIAAVFGLLGLLVLAILIPVIFQYIAYNSIFELTGIDKFKTAALLILIGAILLIIVIGFIIIFIGIIYLILAFSDLPYFARKPATETTAFYYRKKLYRY